LKNENRKMKQLYPILILLFAHLSVYQSDFDSLNTITDEILAVNRDMELEFNKGNYSRIGEFYSDRAAMVRRRLK